MITRRSRAREVAVQLLFQHDLNPYVIRKSIEEFARDRLRDATLIPFSLALYDGVDKQRLLLDEKLGAAADNWRVARMAITDRNVLRVGAYELLYTPETPPQVVLDEAIELARRFGSAESPAFVNGVLDRLRKNALPAAT